MLPVKYLHAVVYTINITRISYHTPRYTESINITPYTIEPNNTIDSSVAHITSHQNTIFRRNTREQNTS